MAVYSYCGLCAVNHCRSKQLRWACVRVHDAVMLGRLVVSLVLVGDARAHAVCWRQERVLLEAIYVESVAWCADVCLSCAWSSCTLTDLMDRCTLSVYVCDDPVKVWSPRRECLHCRPPPSIPVHGIVLWTMNITRKVQRKLHTLVTRGNRGTIECVRCFAVSFPHSSTFWAGLAPRTARHIMTYC